MNTADKLTDTAFYLRNQSSALGLLKGDLEDEGHDLSSDFAEQAQDLIDEAIQKITFALSAMERTAA